MPGDTITNFGAVGGEITTNKRYGTQKRRPFHLIEKVTTTAATHVVLNQQLPANCKIELAQVNFDTAITLSGGSSPVKVGLGISGDPDSILLSGTTMTKNTKTTGEPLTTKLVTAATPIRLSACATGGGQDGNLAGTATVQVFGYVFDDITDAA